MAEVKLARDSNNNDSLQTHYKIIQHLYEKADANERAITQSNKELAQAVSVFRAKTEALPINVAVEVNRELNAAYANLERKFDATANGAGNRIVSKFENANVQAEKAEAAYNKAVKFAIWKVAFVATSTCAASLFIVCYFFMPELYSLRFEERSLTDRIEHLRRDAEEFKRMEGAGLIFTCLDGVKQKRCIRTDETAFGGKPYPVGQATYRAFVGATP